MLFNPLKAEYYVNLFIKFILNWHKGKSNINKYLNFLLIACTVVKRLDQNVKFLNIT